jgi:3-methyladenine DNA glycosylase/8-oxoguanine DNA glycosylase
MVSRFTVPRFDAARAAAHLTQADRRMAALVERVGPLKMPRRPQHGIFEVLLRSIVYQQLHATAAAAIHARVCALFPEGQVAAAHMVGLDDAALRGAGLSQGKLRALRDLGGRVHDGSLPSIEQLAAMSDQEVEQQLVQVRGIGPWTAHMVLIFRLGRPDVLAVSDYGVRQGFRLTYRKKELPTVRELEQRAEAWRPYRSAACWYLWRAVDLSREKKE